MTQYRVISAFNDISDNNLLYKVGDVYPREGTHPTDERVSELLSDANMQRKPLIAKSEDEQPTPPKRKRGKKNEND